MNYSKVEIHGNIGDKHQIEGLLANYSILEIEEISHDVIKELGNEEFSWDYVDPSILSIDEDSLIIRFYLPEDQKDLLSQLLQAFDSSSLGQVKVETIEEEDWANNWKEFFHPIQVAEDLTIVPTWESYRAKEREKVLYMDPGMAFGSGSHETTFMCMKHLYKYVKEEDVVFDIGCGSGILSLVAVAKGCAKVLAVDLDPVCISASRQNIHLNKMEDRIELYEGDLFDKVQGKADVIVSNLFAEVIVDMLEALCQHVKEGGIFIASGILKEKKDLVIQALEEHGFTLLECQDKGDWSSLVAKAK